MRRKSERQNLKGILEGRREAFEAIICQHYKSIYRFMVHLSGDASFAEDLTQETFTTAWSNIDQYEGRSTIGVWLHRIAYNKFIDSKRGVERRAALINKLKERGNNVSISSDPLHNLFADEQSRLIYEAVCILKWPDYIMILLHYIQEMSFREMAEVMEEPIGTVKWKTSKAIKKLKVYLDGKVQPL